MTQVDVSHDRIDCAETRSLDIIHHSPSSLAIDALYTIRGADLGRPVEVQSWLG